MKPNQTNGQEKRANLIQSQTKAMRSIWVSHSSWLHLRRSCLALINFRCLNTTRNERKSCQIFSVNVNGDGLIGSRLKTWPSIHLPNRMNTQSDPYRTGKDPTRRQASVTISSGSQQNATTARASEQPVVARSRARASLWVTVPVIWFVCLGTFGGHYRALIFAISKQSLPRQHIGNILPFLCAS